MSLGQPYAGYLRPLYTLLEFLQNSNHRPELAVARRLHMPLDYAVTCAPLIPRFMQIDTQLQFDPPEITAH